MDRHVSGSFKIPPATMNIFNTLSLLLTLAIYDQIIVPIRRRYSGKPARVSYLRRMGIGLTISILSTCVAGFVEVKRKTVAARAGLLDQPLSAIPISVFWLVPQYSLHGIAEAFMAVGHLEFMYDRFPESMRSIGIALFWILLSAGNYLSTLLVTLVHKYTGKKHNWLPNHNLNKGKLEYYWLVTGIQVVNLGYYILCALFYRYKPIELVNPENQATNGVDGNGHVELAMTNANRERRIVDPEAGAVRPE